MKARSRDSLREAEEVIRGTADLPLHGMADENLLDDLLLAELRARRERLERWLHLVRRELTITQDPTQARPRRNRLCLHSKRSPAL